MAETKHKKTAPRQVFDVAKPGKSAPAPSGRPIIVSSGPIMKDPMVTDDDKSAEESKPTLTSVRSHKIVLQPLNPISSNDEASPAPGAPALTDAKSVPDLPKLPVEEVTDTAESSTDDTPAAKAEETEAPALGAPLLPEADAKTEPAQESESPEETPEQPATDVAETTPVEDEEPEDTPDDASSISGELPLGDGTATESLSESDQKEALAAQKLAEEQEKIVESGKYFLPINAAHHRRSKRRFAFVIVVVLVLMAAFALAAWDADLISVPGYTAPTNYL